MPALEQELSDDPYREFILHGIKHGFDIIDTNAVISPVSSDKHPSARPLSALYKKASEQVLKEIALGNYAICNTPPEIIQKSDSDVLLIHDCSLPVSSEVHDYSSTTGSRNF